jgi:hypothetical protein
MHSTIYELTTSHDDYVCDLTREQAITLAHAAFGLSRPREDAIKDFDAAMDAGGIYGLGNPRIRVKQAA